MVCSLKSIKKSAQFLQLGEIDWNKLSLFISEKAQKCIEPAVLKVTLTRGIGGRGYSPIGCHQPTIIISQSVWPSYYHDWQKKGITLGVNSYRLGQNPELAGYKHCNRLEQVLIKQKLEQTPHDDSVVCDFKGNIIETSASNIFWLKDNVFYTPNLELAGVLGIMRQQVIDYLAQQNQTIKIVNRQIETLDACDEIFITNALMGIVPVNTFINQQNCHYSFSMKRTLQIQKELIQC
ncbi:aminodeoxychorismate lyase [Vibrio sp. SS-MA-C1-2]|uniref:aminodeoxychorismate lyase n=1 Tax=Vibrio sp. SS-MA-C1-2 TaxID=2908646 RepID=UPI001F2F6D28|nr:aminodeoxychorismate lyase [Vibrio sp. SS-MA-C1-2]UJF19920.1 aminodeoxychorismate lyase [Vibrio sp. SS-MA-C1-2]